MRRAHPHAVALLALALSGPMVACSNDLEIEDLAAQPDEVPDASDLPDAAPNNDAPPASPFCEDHDLVDCRGLIAGNRDLETVRLDRDSADICVGVQETFQNVGGDLITEGCQGDSCQCTRLELRFRAQITIDDTCAEARACNAIDNLLPDTDCQRRLGGACACTIDRDIRLEPDRCNSQLDTLQADELSFKCCYDLVQGNVHLFTDDQGDLPPLELIYR